MAWKSAIVALGLLAYGPVQASGHGLSSNAFLFVISLAAFPSQADTADQKANPFNAGVNGQPPLWSLRPLSNSTFPTVKRADWPKTPIDHYILSKLESHGLEPARGADKRTLIRRVTFDLIGLPPSPDEIRAFLADDSPEAFARVVDRLLASPHYGERWGRHWLDVARYADSNGMDENLAFANAFRYRDYVIASFNGDKPYSQFVREQLAGDLLVPARDTATSQGSGAGTDPLVATGFLTLGPKMLAEDDPIKMEMDIIDEQVDTIGRTFLGLTLGCARCHDHKFDPVRMEDYYALAGIFKSTKTMDNFKVVARWHERPLGTEDAIAEQQAKQQEIADRKSEAGRITGAANETLLHAARRRLADYLIAGHDALEIELLQRDLKSVASTAPPGMILIESENYARGNVKKEFTGYGAGIGVIYNQGELPNYAEYDFELPSSETYQFEVRYAAADARPVRILLNGQLVKGDAAGKVTGSWFPDTQTWSPEAIVPLAAGKNTIRFERNDAFPHLDKFALIPRKLPASLTSQPLWTVEQVAAKRDLNVDIVRQWSRYLEQTKDDPSSPLYAWHQFARPLPQSDGAELFAELQRTGLHAIASRYQELFDHADRAWQELQPRQDGKEVKELPDTRQEALRKLLYDPKGPFALPADPERYYSAETAARLKQLRDETAVMEKSITLLPEAMAVRDGKPQDLPVHLRGNHLTLGPHVPRGFPRAIKSEQTTITENESGRLQLADWLTQPDHPLTSRVIVNRIWRWHFGDGLVRSTDNFGQLGESPSHPELLDWLARYLIDSGWSVKELHRLIIFSATYQMSTTYDSSAAQVDPENRLHWRMNRRRLEAEAIRDAMLAASGQLDTTMGDSLLDGANRTYVKGYPNSNYDKYDSRRRSVYLPVLRSMLYDVFQAFDFPDPSTPNGERANTTVAPQALFALNSKLIGEQSKGMASRLLAASNMDDRTRVHDAYERAFGRVPSDAELLRALVFLDRYEVELRRSGSDAGEIRFRAWQALCRALLASSEFMYVD